MKVKIYNHFHKDDKMAQVQDEIGPVKFKKKKKYPTLEDIGDRYIRDRKGMY